MEQPTSQPNTPLPPKFRLSSSDNLGTLKSESMEDMFLFPQPQIIFFKSLNYKQHTKNINKEIKNQINNNNLNKEIKNQINNKNINKKMKNQKR